jgi:hypothetical protein
MADALKGVTDTVGETTKGVTDKVSETTQGAGKTAGDTTKGATDTAKGKFIFQREVCGHADHATGATGKATGGGGQDHLGLGNTSL